MIPTRLILRNFMSYGDELTDLDFTDMHVACLSGDNGNGKSAILDAITYALWGKTRASGSQAAGEDDLIRLSAQDMEVSLEFDVESARYRSMRRRSRGHSGEWQLQILDAEGVYRPAGGSGVRDTERTLVRILRMEYETFLNSAYFQQGRADEFTRQRPDARKRILSDILELGRYDRLEELAREARTTADASLRELDGELRLLTGQIEEEPRVRERLAAAQAELATATSTHEAAQERLTSLRAQLSAMDEKARRAQERAQRLTEAQRALAQLDTAIEQLSEAVQRDTAAVADRPAVEADFRRLSEARKRVAELEPEMRRLNALERDRLVAVAALDCARQLIESDLRVTDTGLVHAREAAGGVVRLDAELQRLQADLARASSAEADLATCESELEEAADAFAALKAENDRLVTEIAEAAEVVQLLGSAGAACPVCSGDLSGDRRARVEERQRARLDELQGRKRANAAAGAAAKQKRDALQKQVAALESRARETATLRGRVDQLAARRSEAAERAAELTALEASARELHRRLDEADYGQPERAALAAVDAQLRGLRSVASEHAATSAEVERLTDRRVEQRLADLQAAERGLTENTARLDTARSERQDLLERMERERSELAALQSEVAGIGDLRAACADAESAALAAEEARASSRATADRQEQLLLACARARDEAAAKLKVHGQVAHDKQAYTELAAAFGKRGVQALIIDNALPEIEHEANRLLARMTENAMQLQLSTLRQARAGKGQVETLDITITDDAGTRPYEMFSGGEGFRVNFALRIALARMLSHRAGAPLQTLIIDEGFGTQDARGLDRLVEAIDSVKDEFALILVISHIDALKDAFPTRIEVTKTPSGSRISYID